ncbi:MAG: LptA/OstA family protein, partial [Candidatus Eremiobacterota bacterium]
MYLYRKTLLSLFFFPAFIIFLSLNIVLSQGQSTPPLPSAPSALPSAIPSLPSSPVPPATPPAVPPAPPTAPPSSVRDDEEKSRVQISSDNLSGDDNKKMFRFWGNVNIRQKDGLLTSDEAVYNSKTKEAYANKNVKFTRPGTTITSDKVTVYY